MGPGLLLILVYICVLLILVYICVLLILVYMCFNGSVGSRAPSVYLTLEGYLCGSVFFGAGV